MYWSNFTVFVPIVSIHNMLSLVKAVTGQATSHHLNQVDPAQWGKYVSPGFNELISGYSSTAFQHCHQQLYFRTLLEVQKVLMSLEYTAATG